VPFSLTRRATPWSSRRSRAARSRSRWRQLGGTLQGSGLSCASALTMTNQRDGTALVVW
jgi:hypothetical protein